MLSCIRQEVESARLDWQGAASTMDVGLWHVAVGRFDYAAFHAVTALLMARTGKRAKTHKGFLHLAADFAKRFPDELGEASIDGLRELMEMRHRADYLAPPSITQKHAALAQNLAEPIVNACLGHPLLLDGDESAPVGKWDGGRSASNDGGPELND